MPPPCFCQSEAPASRRQARSGAQRRWAAKEANAGAVAFWRQGTPDLGEFDDAVILKTFGEVPDDFRFGS
jgi:hypothetical protein